MPVLTGTGEHHAAALAVVLGHVEEGGHGHVQLAGDELEHVDAGLGGTGLPATDCLAGDVKPACQLLLGEPTLPAQAGEGILKHDHRKFLSLGFFSPIVLEGGAASKQQVVARPSRQSRAPGACFTSVKTG